MRASSSLWAVALLLTACRAEAPSPAAEPIAEPPRAPTVGRGAGEMVFSYVDRASGKPVTTSSIGAIPDEARAEVVVTDLSRSPAERQAAKFVFIADLRTAREDGTYPVSVMSRFSYRPEGAAAQAAAEGGEGVIVYSTSWCGVCKRTKSLLKSWGVPYVEKDVEASRSAAEELAGKSQRAGLRGGGVPVIDVAGTLLQGLDEGTLKSVLKQKGLWKGA
ncbi:MAG: glutaredoxin family protein [Myxococcota bacterium]